MPQTAMDCVKTPRAIAETAIELPAALTMISGTLKPLPVTQKSWPATVNPFGKSRKAVRVTAKEIAARWKGKGEAPNANGRLAPAVARI